MSRGRAPRQDGRPAWTRLNGWHSDAPHAVPNHPDDGDAALRALIDIHVVRRLLDRAELNAVKTSRRNDKSWTDIATMLHMTRQSAWERWHDIDPAPDLAAPPAPLPNLRSLRSQDVVIPIHRQRGTTRAVDRECQVIQRGLGRFPVLALAGDCPQLSLEG